MTPSAIRKLLFLTVLLPGSFMSSRVIGNEFQVRVVDAKTREPVSVRMSIRNARGSLIKQRGIPYHGGYFCFFGTHNFKLPRGVYSYTIEKGLEYKTVTGQFEIKRDANDGVTVAIPRFTDMNKRGWWSGDLIVQRSLKDLPILMDANGLSFANWIAESSAGLSDKSGFPGKVLNSPGDKLGFSQTGTLDQRKGGTVLWVGNSNRVKMPPVGSSLPHRLPGAGPIGESLLFLDHASAWDLPVLLADSGKARQENHPVQLHGIAIAGGTVTANSQKIRREDLRPIPSSFPGEHPFARWQMAIYFHVLNCGFKIPPVASSNSGDSLNPVGYNRVYVHVGQKYSPEKWLENLKQGRVIVTNSPVMNVLFNGVLPGETFLIDKGQSLEIEPTLTLSLKEKAEYLEIIRNGFVAEKISLDDYAKARGRLPKLTFQDSGWMAIRVVIANKESYRFALSGPVYVQVGDKRILKQESAQFFLDWVVERAKMIRDSGTENNRQTIEQMRSAYEFWKKMVEQAASSH